MGQFQTSGQATVQACPVCHGRGTMPAGFFTGLPHTNAETCRPCNGGGLLWIATGQPVRIGAPDAE